MWTRIARVLSNKTIMLRLLITLLLLLAFRVASHITIPLLDVDRYTQAITSNQGFLGILDNFSGQALQRMSIMALGISPYITASIVVQLLQMVVPSIKEWAEQGESGKQKVNKVTRYSALGLAFIQGFALIIGVGPGVGNQFVADISIPSPFLYVYTSLTIVAGTALAIFIGDLITKKGIGNGTSMLIAAGIVTSVPTMASAVWQKYIVENAPFWNYVWFALVWILYFAVLLGVVYLQIAKRKIPVQYANRQGKTDSNIPMRLNSAGVIPVIFASTILSIPLMIASFTSASTSGSWVQAVFSYQKPIGYIIYVILIVIFSFFYSFLTIDPNKIADNLSKSNAYIPSVKPGEDTKNFIARLLFKITVIGTVYLVLLASIPIFTAIIFGFGDQSQAITIGGTSLLIIVGVATETTQQVETDAEKAEYSGIL